MPITHRRRFAHRRELLERRHRHRRGQSRIRRSLNGIAGQLAIGGKPAGKGNAEDPYATLSWLANHLAERGRGLKAGMVVITGSVIPTMSIKPGDHAMFSVAGLGDVEVVAV